MKNGTWFAGLLTACTAFSLQAAERFWNGADGDNWTNSAVWLDAAGAPASAPDNTDTATITNGLTVNLTGAALTDTNRFALVQLSGSQRGTLVVGPGGYLPTVGLSISQNGSGPGTPGRLIVDGGSLNVTGAVLVGTDNLNNPGRLEILNGGSFTNGNSVNGAAPVRVYNGTILVSNATFNTAFTTYLHGSSQTSVFEVVDGTVNMTAFAIGRDVQNASGKACRTVLRLRSGFMRTTSDIEVGHTGSGSLTITGAVEQTGGQLLSASGNVRMPINASAVGEYQLSGGVFSIQNTSDSFFLGGRDGAGKGFFTAAGGVFTNKGNTQVGSYTGGLGVVTISGGFADFEKLLTAGSAPRSTGEIALVSGTLALGQAPRFSSATPATRSGAARSAADC